MADHSTEPAAQGAAAIDAARLRADFARLASPGQARALVDMARSAIATQGALRIGIVHTYTSDLLDPWLDAAAAIEGFSADIHHAPYGLALGEAQPGSALAAFRPDLLLLLLQPADLDPALDRPVAGLDAGARDALATAAVERLVALAGSFATVGAGRTIATVLPALSPPDLGLFDAQGEGSQAALRATIRARAGTALRERVAGATLLDLDSLFAQVGLDAGFDRRFWYSARFPFTPPAAAELARRVVALGVALKRPRAKVIALDADNTLWGGVIGEDGIEGIALGPDYPGACYVDFQRRIEGLQQRGFILVLVSKNNEADVLEVLRTHPHMLLREDAFAAMRVNWRPKVDNLADLAEELQLGLDSFVFVDDSDYEVALMRRELPMVDCIQVPARAVDVPACLDRVPRLEILALTAEDRAKTAMYAAERERRKLRRTMEGEGVDLAAYLRSLDMRMTIGLDDARRVKRISQLTNKTNQFNLTTRRYDEGAIAAMVADPSWTVAHFSLADSFGDSGVVGVALIERLAPARARLDSFLMSCRVIGREAEAAFLSALLRRLAGDGVRQVDAEFLPTPKNALASGFLAANDFEPGPDGGWIRDLASAPPSAADAWPIAVDLAEC
jgi:FkbH-like protein